MTGYIKRAIFCLVLPLLLGTAVYGGPDDIVPRVAVTYDLLGSLAAAGHLKGYTLSDFLRGDRLYSRREIARLLAANAGQLIGEGSDPRFAAAVRTLFMEFAPELKLLGVAVPANSALYADHPGGAASAKARFLTGPTQGTGTFRFTGTTPVGRDGIAVVGGGNEREEWYRSVPGLSTAARGSHTDYTYPLIENAYVRLNGRALDVSVGIMPLRWGPGYVGGMLISDEVSSIPQIKLEKDFRLPGAFGRHLGALAFTQTYGQFFEDDDPAAPENARGTRRHFGARRLETAGNGRFQFSVGEAYKATRLPEFYVPNFVPYYLYQNDWTTESRNRILTFLAKHPEPNTNWFNYFADTALSYRVDDRGTIVYVDYSLDDIKAPFGLKNPKNTTTPRKLGQQYGVYLPDLGRVKRYGLRLEYSTSDRETYTNISQPVAWERDGVPLGFPGGPNARIFFTRLDARINDRATMAIEGQLRRRGATLPDRDDPNVDRLGLYCSYDLRPNVFVGGRFEYQKTDWQVGDGSKRTRLEVNVGFGI